MAASKLPVFLVAVALVVAGIRAADAGIDGGIAPPEDSESQLRLEINQLASQISALESSISDRTRELDSKDDKVAELEKTIQEKSASIISLQGEIELLHVRLCWIQRTKGEQDAEKMIGKTHARANELENQVGDIRKEIETQNRMREALEARASDAEKQVQELNLKVENLEKENEEQKHIIQKIERALHVAEEELLRAHLEATSKSKELTEVHGAWLPPWLANLIYRCQDFTVTHWNENGKPALDLFLEKASGKSAQVQKWAEPHLEIVKTKWIPIAKERWITLTTHVGPYVDALSTRTIESYEICKTTIRPHIIKVQEVADPYFQNAKKFTKPHIDQAATCVKPHVEKVRAILKPYTEHIVYAYGQFLKFATVYHHQAQAAIHEKLEKIEFTKSLATNELVWFMASALLALPIFFLYKIFSAIFCKKCRQPTRNAHANETPRRPKRRYADK